MSLLDQLISNYKKQLELPLRQNLPLSQRVWFLVYPPEEERRINAKISEFEIVTRNKLNWKHISLLGAFSDWMDTFEDEERETCLSSPDIIENYADPGFRDFLCNNILQQINSLKEEEKKITIFALSGLMELFDFLHVSTVIDSLDNNFPGILLLFFPGDREGNTYRFLGARKGWDYLGVPILAEG